eukprot:gb/GECH01013887.1/.p1 GENE.gb/GECH01013887.1/~~gb/GECH01013887.1/.p1  ORF type:complete len:644 (+),score=213.47 gb/GECH01013887.1/:1-1932(+)
MADHQEQPPPPSSLEQQQHHDHRPSPPPTPPRPQRPLKFVHNDNEGDSNEHGQDKMEPLGGQNNAHHYDHDDEVEEEHVSEEIVSPQPHLSRKRTISILRKQRRAVNKKGETIYKGHQSYGLVKKMQLGLSHTILKTANRANRDIKLMDFRERLKVFFPKGGCLTKGSETQPHDQEDFQFKDYSPVAFAHIRGRFNIDSQDFVNALAGDGSLTELSTPGKSGSVFFFSHGMEYIIKTVTKKEAKVLQEILPFYYNHIMQNQNTLICRFYGFYRVKPLHGSNVRFVVMNNVFPTDLKIHETYDLKGSTVGRSATFENRTTGVLKDNDLRSALCLKKFTRDQLEQQIRRDCKFLESIKVMDYSLLLGIRYRNKETSHWRRLHHEYIKEQQQYNQQQQQQSLSSTASSSSVGSSSAAASSSSSSQIHNNNNNNLDNNNIGEKKEEQEEETITIFHYSCGDSINANTTSQLNQEGFSNGRLLFDYPKKQRGVFVVHSGSLSDPEEKNNNHHFNSKKSKKQRKKHIKQNLSKEERRERVESNKFKRRKERQIRQEGRNSLNNNSDDSSNDDTNNNEEGKYSNNHNSNNTNQHKRIVRLSDKKQNYKMKKIPYCCPLCEGSKPPLQGSAKKRKGAQKKNKLALHQETEF